MANLANGTRIGDYVIESLLSDKGGMSEIYLAALYGQPTYKVALKFPRKVETNQNAYQDLLRDEANFLAKLRHPGIVRVFPLTQAGGKTTYLARAAALPQQPWYFAMEYVPGSDLAKYVKQIAKFPLPWITELFYQIAVTIQFMHTKDQGYGHCDIKPENILMREVPDPHRPPQPVFVDFGTVKPFDAPITQPALSLKYSSPEVVQAHIRKDIPPEQFPLQPEKIDIWALGVLLFELITGQELFNQRKDDEITTSILRGKLKRIRDLRPEINPSFDILLNEMLKQDPDERPDIDDVIEVLEERISNVRPPRIPMANTHSKH
ncbi:MAG: serine/threonine protein kinase [Anaerolineales bacterium]|nr:serine/threonine protein kinase [Anaerolineales bacterium]